MGEKRLIRLYKHFKTLDSIYSASVDDLCEKVGVSIEIAKKIKKGYE